MQKKYLLIFLILIFVIDEEIVAQEEIVDSMMYYYNSGNYSKAIFFSEKNVAALKQKVGEEDTLYGEAINDLGAFYFFSGNNKAAKPLYIKAAEIYKAAHGAFSSEYATCLNNLARLYNVVKDFSSAETMYLEVLKIYKKNHGEQNADYARTLDNLGVLYNEIDKNSLAEKYCLKALEIRKKTLGEDNLEYAISLNNLATVYSSLFNYSAAAPLLNKAVSIMKKQLGEKHPDYATALGNLSIMYLDANNYAEAVSLAKKDVMIKKEVLGENHSSYATALDNLAGLYALNPNDSIAEPLYKEVLTIQKRTIGTEQLDYSFTLFYLANYYTSKGNYFVADSLYKEALIIRKRNLGEEHSDYIQILKFQANLCQLMGNYLKAKDLTLVILAKEKEFLINKLSFLSETELLKYLKFIEVAFTLPYANLWNYNSPEVVQSAYNSHLLFKSISLQNTTSLRLQMSHSKDSVLVTLWNEYKNNRTLLNKILTLPIAKRTINTDSLNEVTNQQEKDLLGSSAAYRNMKDKLNTTWQNVRSGLKIHEAAIEFVKFNSLKRTLKEADTVYYAAMLLRPTDTVPVFIKLFEEKQLKNALKSFVYTAPVQYRGSNNAADKKSLSQNVKSNVYNVVWQPLERYLTNTKTIYFAPDGLLHQLAFAAMPYHKDSLLCDRYNLIQVTSTRQVAIKDSNQTVSSVALFGGINYNKQQTDTSTSANADPYAYVYQQNRSADLDSFNYLPNTKNEVLNIEKRMEQKKRKVYLFSGEKATEEAFRNLGGPSSPDIIHFATHGFTLPDAAKQKSENNTFKISDNPLLRAGLVLAGGNKGWKGKSTLDEDDGILTALEISSVPLQHTQLAVLSACETGVGELHGSEGVFGLQRAFKLAGVNYIMASLWQVPDKETSEFMNDFYTNLLAGKSIRQSFIITQKTMRKKHAPYYWAAFTLVQ